MCADGGENLRMPYLGKLHDHVADTPGSAMHEQVLVIEFAEFQQAFPCGNGDQW